MKSAGAQSSNELQKFDLMTRHRDSSSSNGHQGDMPNYMADIRALLVMGWHATLHCREPLIIHGLYS